MNTITLKTIAAIIVAVILLASSCSKDVYAPPGATGPTGNTGPIGPAGNANVKHQTDTAKTWSSGTSNYYVTFVDSNLTAAIQDSGTVQVFMSIDGGTTWSALPLTKYSSYNSLYSMGYTTQKYSVSVQWSNIDPVVTGIGNDPNSVYGVTFTLIKVICIAPCARRANPNLNLNNFGDIKAAFHLK